MVERAKPAVGQKLWWVPTDTRDHNYALEITVTKVARKWADTDNQYRIDVTSWRADGGDYRSPGRCYLSKAEWDEEQAADKAWLEVANAVWRGSRREGVTIDDIHKAAALLGLRAPDA